MIDMMIFVRIFFEMDNQPQSKVGWYIPWYTHWGRVIHFRRHCEKLMTRLFRDGWPYHTIPQKKYRGEHVRNPCQSCEPSGPLHWRLNPFASLKWIDPRLNLGFQGGISMYFNVFQYLRGERLPSGKQPHNYGKSPFLMGKLTISMAIFNSYVKLPEGRCFWILRWMTGTVLLGEAMLESQNGLHGLVARPIFSIRLASDDAWYLLKIWDTRGLDTRNGIDMDRTWGIWEYLCI